MFDQEEEKLLSQALKKARKECQHCMNVYAVSGFDQCFDTELKKLVLLYSFDFEAIALHLYFMFPQYGHRLTPQAVSYRWYQLVLEREGLRIKQELQDIKTKNKQSQDPFDVEQKQFNEEEDNNVVFYDLNYKLKQYETAMIKAQELDEQEEENFMIYKPKFIIDSEYKLERETADNSQGISAMIENEVAWEFGNFEIPQAAPVVDSIPDSSNIALSNKKSSEEDDEEIYFDEDWEAYQSD